MIQQTLLHLLITYKYPIIVPLAFAEGHIISLLSGFLARIGVLNAFLAGALIVTGNLLGDVCLYWIGYHKGEKFALRFGKRFGVTEDGLVRGKEIFHTHKSSILLFSKLTNGFGLAIVILLTAGLMRIKFRTYMFWNSIGEIIWTGGLITIGYFLGSIYQTADSLIAKISLIAIIVLIIVIGFLYLKKYIKNKMNI